MPIYVNFVFGFMTLLTLKRDFITLLILLFLNETVHSQFKNEMIPAFYYWIVPEQQTNNNKNSPGYRQKNTEINVEYIPSFHCQYVWFLNSVLYHYLSFYHIGDYFINYVVILSIGVYVVIHKMNEGKTFTQAFLGVLMGIFYGFVTTKYILYLELPAQCKVH